MKKKIEREEGRKEGRSNHKSRDTQGGSNINKTDTSESNLISNSIQLHKRDGRIKPGEMTQNRKKE